MEKETEGIPREEIDNYADGMTEDKGIERLVGGGKEKEKE
jgi:hypothetical protein